MSNNIPDINQLKIVINFLGTLINTLSARYDANVKASTDTDADYAAELVDARVDAWANENSSLGANIRDGQLRLILGLQQVQMHLQNQIDILSGAIVDICGQLSEIREILRNGGN